METCSVLVTTGRIFPGPGRANFHPDRFVKRDYPHGDIYPVQRVKYDPEFMRPSSVAWLRENSPRLLPA